MNTHISSLLLSLGLALLLAACSGADTQERDPSATPAQLAAPAQATSAPVEPPPPTCVEGARQCRGEDKAVVCRDGAWVETPCGGGARCMGLVGPEAVCRPAKLDSWLPSAEGFINRWRMAGPLDRRTVRRLESTEALLAHADSDGGWSVEAFNTDILELEGRRRWSDKREPTWLLQAQVWSPTARRVRLRPSVTGSMEVWLNDARVFSTTTERWLLVDDNRVDVDLKAGLNTVLLRLEQERPRALRAALRVRGLDNAPLPDLLWSVPGDERADAAPSGCDTLAIQPDLTLRFDSWEATLKVSAPGLVSLPRADQPPRALEVTLSRKERGEPGARLYSAPLEAGLLAQAPQEHSFSVTPESDGLWWLQVRQGDAICASFPLRERAAARRRLAAQESRMSKFAGSLDGIPLAAIESLKHHLASTQALFAAADPDEDHIDRSLSELEQLTTALGEGRDPYATRSGLQQRAYRSAFDGKLQGYTVWVPPSYVKNPDEDFPLVVTFHGLNGSPEEMIRITLGIEQPPGMPREAFARMPVKPRDDRTLVVAPWGYGNVGQRVPGEADVLRVIEEMKANYRVDPRRVSLTGASLGGTVAFVVPLHYPDRFTAAAPLCGYPNVRGYNDVQGARKQPWETWLVEQRSIANYAEGGLHLPLFITHGTKDGPARSEEVVKRYRSLGLQVDFDTPELGHNVWEHAYTAKRKLLSKLARRRAPEHPRRARVRTGHLRYNTAFWLQLDRMTDSAGRFADLNGTRSKSGRVSVETSAVEAFTILGPRLTEHPETVTVEVDGREVGTAHSGGPIHLSRRSGRWAIVDAVDVEPDHKRSGLSGPLDDIWYEPLIVIYGTQDPAQTEANRLVAEHAARYNLRTELIVPVVADTALDADALRGRNVILVGNPRSNLIARQAAASLPVRFEPDALEFFGKRYEGADVGVSFIHPSPFDPARYMVWHAGVTEEGTLSSRHLPEFSPDFLVYKNGIRSAYWGPVLDKREVLDGGFFTDAWSRR